MTRLAVGDRCGTIMQRGPMISCDERLHQDAASALLMCPVGHRMTITGELRAPYVEEVVVR